MVFDDYDRGCGVRFANAYTLIGLVLDWTGIAHLAEQHLYTELVRGDGCLPGPGGVRRGVWLSTVILMRRPTLFLTLPLVAMFALLGASQPVSRAGDEVLSTYVVREAAEIGQGSVISYRQSVRWTEKVCRLVSSSPRKINVCKTVTFTSDAPVKVRFCEPKRSGATPVCRTHTITPSRVPPVVAKPRPTPTVTPVPTPTVTPVPTPTGTPSPGPVDPTPSPTPIVAPIDVPKGSYTFSLLDPSGEPVRFEVCKTLTWSVDGSEAEKALTRSAMAELTTASRLSFKEVPWDGFRPLIDRLPSELDHPMNLVVRWTDASEAPDLAGDVAGVTETRSWMNGSRTRHWISFAAVAIERDPRTVPQRSGGNTVWPILLHELGHAVGLSHAEDQAQLMFPSTWPGTADHYQSGDRAGLAKVGRVYDRCG